MKDHWKRLTALLLALMLLCGLMGCGEASSSGKDEQGEDPAPAEQIEEASPAETAGEEDAARERRRLTARRKNRMRRSPRSI